MGLQSTQGYRGKLVDKLTGTILDQFADEDVKVSNNILELFDIADIPGTYTQQITLPGTNKNNAFFEHYYDISVWEPDIFNTNQVVEAYLDFDGFYLVNGYLQLNKVNVLANKFIDSYEVTLFGIISNFSIDAKTTFLTDISSLRAYNHTSSISNITASWQRNLLNGDIVYPMAEYGQKIFYSQDGQFGINSTSNPLTVQDYKPAIRVKKVWDAIFQEFGYTYTGSFWNEPWLQDVYLFLNNNLKTPIYQPSIENFGQVKADSTVLAYPIIGINQTGSLGFDSIQYNNDNKFQASSIVSTYTVDFPTKLSCDIKLGYSVVPSSGTGTPQFSVIFTTGSTDYTVPLTALNNALLGTATNQFRIRTDSTVFQTPTLPAGTYDLKLFVTASTGGSVFTVYLNPNAESTSTFTVTKVNQAADFKILDVTNNMPFGNSGILVIDFIRALQKKFNLIIYPDKQNPNQFVVETFNNWYKQGKIKDFNRYINLEDKIAFTPANQLGYQQIKFTDADDTDYVETLFKRTNNRIYGEANYYDTGSFYSQGKLEVNSQAIASGPLGLVPGSAYTGSAATNVTSCETWEIYNPSYTTLLTYEYQDCLDPLTTLTDNIGFGQTNIVCAFQQPAILVDDPSYPGQVTSLGSCGPTGSLNQTGSNYPVWIPYYIADQNLQPARVLPRIMFYNGTRNATPYYVEGYTFTTASAAVISQSVYPYFDNYSTGSLNGTSSLFPELNARSLLFNNEQAVWGTTPSSSLISDYWATYLGLLYNPRTRLVEASAVIGLADYFDLELNDIAEFRGNYYHLRAINDYNLTTGECSVQLLGPIIPDTISSILSGSWAPIDNPCAFTYTASLIPMWSGSGVDYGAIGNSFDVTSDDYFNSIYEMPGGTDIMIASNYNTYNSASIITGNSSNNLIITNATGTLLRSNTVPSASTGLPFYSIPVSSDWILMTTLRTSVTPAGTGSYFMISSSLAQLDSTFITNRGSGAGFVSGGTEFFGVTQFNNPVPYLPGDRSKFYIWPASSNRWSGSAYATNAVLRLITDPSSPDRGKLDPTWKYSLTGSNPGTRDVAVQSDGKVVVLTQTPSPTTRYWAPTGSTTASFIANGLFRLNADGTWDSTFNVPSQQAFSSSAFTGPTKLFAEQSAVDSQDNIYIVGRFDTFAKTVPVNCIVKLNKDGILDTSFLANVGTGPSTVGAPYAAAQSQSQALTEVAIEPGTDKVIVAGAFRSWNGTNVQGITRLNPDGTLDSTFTPNTMPTGGFGLPVGAIYSQLGIFAFYAYGQGQEQISFASNGDILVFGDFNNSGPTSQGGSGSAASITNMTWNNSSASFGTSGYLPARIARLTDSGSFPVNGSYII